MEGLGRYVRLLLAFGRFGLVREMTFRSNFLAKVFVEVLWLGVLLAFYGTVFAKTSVVAEWTAAQYMFFVGCFFALEGVIESFFLSNCLEFAELVRSGDLDFYLLKPIDEQFLVTFRDLDWSTVPNIFLGAGIMALSLRQLPDWHFDLLSFLSFLLLFACGVAIAYGFLVMLSSASVWLVRNQNLMEMWWLLSSLMRYPREIFQDSWAALIGKFFTFVAPIMLVVSMPASTMVKALEPAFVMFTVIASVVSLAVSRRLFRYALSRYRSASS